MSESGWSIGVSVVNVDLQEVDRRLAEMGRRAEFMRPVFKEISPSMRADQRDHVHKTAGSDGQWPPRSAVTEARRLAHNKRVRVTKAMRVVALKKPRKLSRPKTLLGRLPTAFRMVYTDHALTMKSTVRWAGIHWRGGNAGHGRKVRIPRREFYWMSDRFVMNARVVIANYVALGYYRSGGL